MNKNRLQKEAEFQNAKTKGELNVYKKKRDRFYYLIDRARDYYNKILIKNTNNNRVIVVGCAEGGVTSVARNGAKYVMGIDIAEEPLNRLSAQIEKEGLSNVIHLTVGNAEDLNVPDEKFDLICCSGVLHHLDIKTAMTSWSAALSGDGKVVMMEPMAYNPIIAVYRLFTPKMRTDDEHPLVPADFKLMNQYFHRAEVRGFVLLTLFSLIFEYILPSSRLKKKTESFLFSADEFLLSIFPFLRFLCWSSVITLEQPRKEGQNPPLK